MPEWIWWVIGGGLSILAVYLIVALIFSVAAGKTILKIFEHIWEE